ncbi:MAG TPA: hypothetical protein VEC18_00320 [Myxococcota bacterium]|nr:hypothetical protein [Myxococcota bacterium]
MKKLLIAIVCGAILAQPVAAHAELAGAERADQVPVALDAFLMRPLGLGATLLGAATVLIFAPVLLFRPQETPQVVNPLVINPFRFTFVDPLGYHPDRVEANRVGMIE